MSELKSNHSAVVAVRAQSEIPDEPCSRRAMQGDDELESHKIEREKKTRSQCLDVPPTDNGADGTGGLP